MEKPRVGRAIKWYQFRRAINYNYVLCHINICSILLLIGGAAGWSSDSGEEMRRRNLSSCEEGKTHPQDIMKRNERDRQQGVKQEAKALLA